MTEEDLIELGFEKILIQDDESQNGYDYYYYNKELCDNIVLYSTDSIDVEDNNWIVKCWDIPAIRITSKDHFMQFVEMIDNITC
jgi:hypothetical protein